MIFWRRSIVEEGVMSRTKGKAGIRINRLFDAPREMVWSTWSDPKIIKKWWGPNLFTAPEIKVDFRVGGKYLFCMQSKNGPAIWQKGIYSTGIYKEIVPLNKIVATDSFADSQGNVVPASFYDMSGDFPLEMLITVTFEEIDQGKTSLELVHEGIPPGEHTIGAKQGWNESLDKLAALLRL